MGVTGGFVRTPHRRCDDAPAPATCVAPDRTPATAPAPGGRPRDGLSGSEIGDAGTGRPMVGLLVVNAGREALTPSIRGHGAPRELAGQPRPAHCALRRYGGPAGW